MKYIFLDGTTPSGTIEPSNKQGVKFYSVQFDVPFDELSTSSPSVTLSGNLTGAYTFHQDQKIEVRFRRDENIALSAANLSGSYQAILGYAYYGDQRAYLDTATRSDVKPLLPSRFSR